MTGLSSSKNSGGGYLGQLGEAQKRLAHANAEEQQCITNLRMVEDELKAAQRKWKDVEKEAKEGSRNFEAKKQEYDALQSKLASCNWNEEKERDLEAALRSAKEEVRSATQVCLLLIFVYDDSKSIPSIEPRSCTQPSRSTGFPVHSAVTELRQIESQGSCSDADPT